MSEKYIKVKLKAPNNELPENFTFPEAKVKLTGANSMIYHKYDDVDLINAEKTFSLSSDGTLNKSSLITTISLIALALLALFMIKRNNSRNHAEADEVPVTRYNIPQTITPVTTLGLLEKLQKQQTLSTKQKQALETDISQLKNNYFGKEEKKTDVKGLTTLAKKWLETATPTT